MPSATPWVLWHLLPFRDRLGIVGAVDVVGEWLEYDHDDERLEDSVTIYLRSRVGKPLTTPDGIEVRVVEQAGELLVELGEDRANVHDMMLAARHLMTADDPPSAPVSAVTAQPICQPATDLSTAPPKSSTFLAQVTTWRPQPVKPAAQRVKLTAPARQQLSLF